MLLVKGSDRFFPVASNKKERMSATYKKLLKIHRIDCPTIVISINIIFSYSYNVQFV